MLQFCLRGTSAAEECLLSRRAGFHYELPLDFLEMLWPID